MTDQRALVLLGTKAQFVKMAPLMLAMDNEGIHYTLVYTGQHSETFEAMQTAFGTRDPDDELIPAFEADTHLSFLSWTIRFWTQALRKRRREKWKSHRVLLVHGDTASTLYGAILGRFLGLRVAHVEAGLRSSSLWDPFPEELIRRFVAKLASIHYCPSDLACSNLNGSSGSVINTHGNTLLDSLQMAIGSQGAAIESIEMNTSNPSYGVVSLHRNENLSNKKRFDSLMRCILQASQIVPLKFVLHPATRKKMQRSGWIERLSSCPGIQILNRMDYFQFIALLLKSKFLMTDGGSNQEEAAQLGIPCLLLRRTTEREDGLGTNVVISGLDIKTILAFVEEHKSSSWRVIDRSVVSKSPCQQIVSSLKDRLL